jgi:hypothetical protein
MQSGKGRILCSIRSANLPQPVNGWGVFRWTRAPMVASHSTMKALLRAALVVITGFGLAECQQQKQSPPKPQIAKIDASLAA